MPLSPVRIPALLGGISRQPTHLRFPGQVQDASNAQFDVASGARKRPGTFLVRELCTPPAIGTDDLRLHAIDRDGSERYLLVYGPGVLRAYPLSGAGATVNFTGAATTYYGLNSPTSDQLRLVTIADYTLIANTTVALAASGSPSFTVSGTFSYYSWINGQRGAVMLSWAPPAQGADSYYQVQYDNAEGDAGYYRWKVSGVPTVGDTGTFATIRFAEVSGPALADAAGQWNDLSAEDLGFLIRFRKKASNQVNAIWSQATLHLLKVGAFTGYTHSFGDVLKVTGGTGVTAGYRQIASKVSNDEIVLSATTGFTLNNADTSFDGIWTQHNVTKMGTGGGIGWGDMYGVAGRVEFALRDAGAADACCFWTSTGYQRGYFTIVSPFRTTDATVEPPTTPTAAFTTDLSLAGQAFDGTAGYTVAAGTGTGANTLAPVDRWVVQTEPNQPNGALDATKMPIQMRRTAVGPPATFSIDVVNWSERTSGDETTNPVPKLWSEGQKISDMAFFQSRLWLLGGPYSVGSQAGDLFNYYNEDALNPTSSDPIDVTLSGNQVTLIDWAIPWRDVLVLFTQAGRQFELAGGAEGLTPASAQATASTSYETLSVRPETNGELLYFLGKFTTAAQLYEYVFSADSVASDAEDVSRHVPGLLPSAFRRLKVHANSRTVLLLPTNSNKIYAYRSYASGGEKRQSAWTVYTFSSTYNIRDIAVIGPDCYMLVKRGGIFYIERFGIADETTEGAVPTFDGCGGGGGGGGGPQCGAAGCATSGDCLSTFDCTTCPATSGGAARCGCYELNLGVCYPNTSGSGGCLGGHVVLMSAKYCCYDNSTTTLLSEVPAGVSANATTACRAVFPDGCVVPCGGKSTPASVTVDSI